MGIEDNRYSVSMKEEGENSNLDDAFPLPLFSTSLLVSLIAGDDLILNQTGKKKNKNKNRIN